MNCTGKKFGYTACNIFVDTTDNPTCNEYDNPATDRTGVKTDAVKDYGKYRYEYGSGTPDRTLLRFITVPPVTTKQ